MIQGEKNTIPHHRQSTKKKNNNYTSALLKTLISAQFKPTMYPTQCNEQLPSDMNNLEKLKRLKHLSNMKKKIIPHASSVFQGIRSTLQRAVEMTMDFVLAFAALVQKG